MDEARHPGKIRHKISVAVESGYKCHVCGWETVTFDGSAPSVCSHCQAPNPVLVWKDKITNQITVETLKLS